VSKLMQAEFLISQEISKADSIRQLGVSELMLYLYRRLSRCNLISI
jgi:hypothetical protein